MKHEAVAASRCCQTVKLGSVRDVNRDTLERTVCDHRVAVRLPGDRRDKPVGVLQDQRGTAGVHDHAIVSPIPGTTRDTIEETANIRGVPVVFIDTAGLREAGDEIEVEGMRRSRQSLERAELILHVFDASEPLTLADETYLTEFADKKRVLLRNKVDLAQRLPASELERRSPLRRDRAATCQRAGSETGAPIVDVSCTTGQGIEALKDAIKLLVWSGTVVAGMDQVMINSRHQDALRRARESTVLTLEALRGNLPLDLVAVDLHAAVNAVGEVVGQTTTEDSLDSIFSQFCIGK